MASIRIHPNSPRFQAVLRVGGRSTSRATSVAVPDDGRKRTMERARARAQQEADALERAERERLATGGAGKVPETFDAMVAAILQEAENQPHPPAASTLAAYRQALGSFRKSLGGDLALDAIGPVHVRRWRAELESEGYAVATRQQREAILRTAFGQAAGLGWTRSNPFGSKVPTLGGRSAKKKAHEDSQRTHREPFTIEEVRALLNVAEEAWRLPILCGFYLGLRLADAARLRWRDVDLSTGTMRVVPEKTQRELSLPLPAPIRARLAAVPEAEREGFIEPSMARRSVSSLSRSFGGLVKRAGIDATVREGRRRTSSKTFHGLRHSAASALANAGVGAEVRMALLGHASEAVHAGYTHMEADRLQKAVDLLPAVG